MRLLRRLAPGILAVGVALATLTPVPADAREQRIVAIGGLELTVALADGDCFLDPDQPADRTLIEQLGSATGSEFIPLVAFGGCDAIAGWRAGSAPTLTRLGYVMIAEKHLEPVFAFDQQAFGQAIAQALADSGVTDYRADISRLAGDFERIWPSLPAGGKQELGIVHRDRHGPVLATVLSVPGAGRPTPRLMLYQSILVRGKVLSVVATRNYRDSESIFETYGDLSAVVEATAARNPA